MRIVTERPLEIETYRSVQQHFSSELRIGEISRFCIIPKFRRVHRSQVVHAGMWTLAASFAHEERLDGFLIWCKADLEALYTYLGFAKLEIPPFSHPLLSGQVHSVMYAPLTRFSTHRALDRSVAE